MDAPAVLDVMTSTTTISPPYLLYLGDAHDELAIKTARGLAVWRPQWCLGQFRGPQCKAWLDLPDLTPAEARSAGANTMVVGTANAGGVMSAQTVQDIVAAIESGLNIASGLHQRLDAHPEIVAAATRTGRMLFDARRFPHPLPVGNGKPRAGRRLLTVGTDCSVGAPESTLSNNVDGSTENIALGESGNPYSPYFRDQWNDYYNGTTFAFPFSPPAVAADTGHTLRLMP